MFGVTIEVFGDTTQPFAIGRGLAGSGSLASYGEAGRLVGAISIRPSAERETPLKGLISERSPADAATRFGRRTVVKRSRLHRGARAVASGGEPVEQVRLGDSVLRDEDVRRVGAPTRVAGRAAT